MLNNKREHTLLMILFEASNINIDVTGQWLKVLELFSESCPTDAARFRAAFARAPCRTAPSANRRRHSRDRGAAAVDHFDERISQGGVSHKTPLYFALALLFPTNKL